jgi:lipopolysaccharide/colanic/teichoic acid biosynthesis glycosyltransferase
MMRVMIIVVAAAGLGVFLLLFLLLLLLLLFARGGVSSVGLILYHQVSYSAGRTDTRSVNDRGDT